MLRRRELDWTEQEVADHDHTFGSARRSVNRRPCRRRVAGEPGRGGGACGEIRGLPAHRRGPEELFGNAVAPAGDVNGDGVADVLVGAPGVDQGGGEWSGRVYLFLGPVDGERSASEADAIFTAEGVNDNLGYSIGAGDLNDDGLDDVILGARSNDWAGIQAGRVYVFFGPVPAPGRSLEPTSRSRARSSTRLAARSPPATSMTTESAISWSEHTLPAVPARSARDRRRCSSDP